MIDRPATDWRGLRVPVLIAVGSVALLPVLPNDRLLLTAPLVGTGLGLVLLFAFVTDGYDLRSRDLALVFTVFVGTVSVGLALTDRTWLVAVTLLTLATLCVYGLHRYELVVLGAVNGGRS